MLEITPVRTLVDSDRAQPETAFAYEFLGQLKTAVKKMRGRLGRADDESDDEKAPVDESTDAQKLNIGITYVPGLNREDLLASGEAIRRRYALKTLYRPRARAV